MRQKIIAAICIMAGLAVLAVPLFYSLYGEMQNKQLIKEIEQTIVEDTGHEEEVQQDKGKTSSDKEEETLFEDGDVIGIIEIETLDLKYPIVEGAGSSELSVGIGHIPDTAGIGDTGNCVLAGHRGSRYGTYFKYLNRLQEGDCIRLTDKEGNQYVYVVAETEVVGPYDNSVKNQGQEKELTLLTCENNGTMRLIVKCTMSEEN